MLASCVRKSTFFFFTKSFLRSWDKEKTLHHHVSLLLFFLFFVKYASFYFLFVFFCFSAAVWDIFVLIHEQCIIFYLLFKNLNLYFLLQVNRLKSLLLCKKKEVKSNNDCIILIFSFYLFFLELQQTIIIVLFIRDTLAWHFQK